MEGWESSLLGILMRLIIWYDVGLSLMRHILGPSSLKPKYSGGDIFVSMMFFLPFGQVVNGIFHI